MRFDPALLEEFRALLQTTGLQRAHGEFVRMFRWLRAELERQMPDFCFQNAVSGSAIDYAYFTFSDEALRQKGLKLAVVFGAGSLRLGGRVRPGAAGLQPLHGVDLVLHQHGRHHAFGYRAS